MIKVVIIGGGFGGLSASRRLCKSGIKLEVILIDKKQTVDFLPMLPDCIGRMLSPDFLSYRIEDLGGKLGFNFINGEVITLDLDKKEVSVNSEGLKYDYLIIASGSETNFYGNQGIRQYACVLGGVSDARKMVDRLSQGKFDNYVVGGGGYTGIEVATNLRLFLNRNNKKGKIVIVERAPEILGTLPEWMKEYVVDNLRRLDIEISVNNTIDIIEERRIHLSEGKTLDNTFVVWTAGVKTSSFIQNLKVDKNPQGRIKVDEYLRLNNNCFVIGDAASFSHQEGILRMAVQFAITQGDFAGANIIRAIKGLGLHKYKARDLGYIIPMANNRSCGSILGLNFKGSLPTILHFIMCIYRSYGIRNKIGIIKDLLKNRCL